MRRPRHIARNLHRLPHIGPLQRQRQQYPQRCAVHLHLCHCHPFRLHHTCQIGPLPRQDQNLPRRNIRIGPVQQQRRPTNRFRQRQRGQDQCQRIGRNRHPPQIKAADIHPMPVTRHPQTRHLTTDPECLDRRCVHLRGRRPAFRHHPRHPRPQHQQHPRCHRIISPVQKQRQMRCIRSPRRIRRGQCPRRRQQRCGLGKHRRQRSGRRAHRHHIMPEYPRHIAQMHRCQARRPARRCRKARLHLGQRHRLILRPIQNLGPWPALRQQIRPERRRRRAPQTRRHRARRQHRRRQHRHRPRCSPRHQRQPLQPRRPRHHPPHTAQQTAARCLRHPNGIQQRHSRTHWRHLRCRPDIHPGRTRQHRLRPCQQGPDRVPSRLQA